MGEREAMRGTEGSAGGRDGDVGGQAVRTKLRGLTGWLLLWNVPLTAKTRPPTAACYRQVHGPGKAGGGWLVEREVGWGVGKQMELRTVKCINKQFGHKSSMERFKVKWSISVLWRDYVTWNQTKITAQCNNNHEWATWCSIFKNQLHMCTDERGNQQWAGDQPQTMLM